MASALSIIWGKLIHDLTLYEREVHPQILGASTFHNEEESEEAREERLQMEIAGAPGSQL